MNSALNKKGKSKMAPQTIEKSTAGPDDARYQNLAEKAWLIWQKATQIADNLWNEFEPYFIDKCIQEQEDDLGDLPAAD
jgi:hypothetical protein